MNESIMQVLKDRYFLRGESSWEDIAKRVGGIYEPATELIKSMKFIPSTPTLMNGNTKGQRLGGLSSCFPMGLEDSIEGIFDSLKDAAMVTKAAGGIGYNFSRLRSSKEIVGSLDGRTSTGPLPFMDMFNSMLDGIRQGGARRGAGMAMLDVDHPDILDFIDSKKDWQSQRLARFNISVRMSDEFYQKLDETPDAPMIVRNVVDRKEHELKDHEGKVISYKDLWNKIISMAHHCAEPGIFNSDIAYRQCTVTNYSQDVLANPCCLTGDTIINTDRGPMTIKDISDLPFEERVSIKVMSYNPNRDEIIYETIENAWKAKTADDIYEIETEDGIVLKLTSDHNVLTERGYVEVKNLNENDNIISYY